MKRLFLLLSCIACGLTANSQSSTFVRGADVSWCTEMEASGKKFYNASGQQTELMALMKQLGMNAIRLRVWVNPENAYGAWSDKADVLAKARRAHEQGLSLLIDFHYSDFFADPGRQDKPAAWSSYNMTQLKQAVTDHTKDVLQALKDEGIEPQWVQVGNETRVGMIWDSGKIDWNSSTPWTGYVTLSNAGYDAVKAVLPNAKVIVHIDRGPENNNGFYRQFKAAGGKFDIIGLSHYPEKSSYTSENTATANNIKLLGNEFGVPVMVVETGFYIDDETLAETVMADFFTKAKAQSRCAGIFYWEPEVYNWWKPTYYTTLGWNAYNRGAFKSNGRPAKTLNPFYDEEAAGITPTTLTPDASTRLYDLQGHRLTAPTRGIVIEKRGKSTRKVVRQ